MPNTSSYIEISGLKKSYPTEDGSTKEVLRGVDLSINKGEIFGIIGFSGAGKSTLARCINRLEEPDEGKILVNGVDVLSLNRKQLRRERSRMGMIFQTFNLFDSKNVYDNIAFPLHIAHEPKKDIDERVHAAAQVVGLEDKLGEFPGALSGGQKQRVGIARAIVSNPTVLLSDEATSALDPQTTIQILDLLKEINEQTGLTILMITHELEAIKYLCRRVAVLENGKVVEGGLVDDVFSNPQSKTGAIFTKVYNRLQNSNADAEAVGKDEAERLSVLQGKGPAATGNATSNAAASVATGTSADDLKAVAI